MTPSRRIRVRRPPPQQRLVPTGTATRDDPGGFRLPSGPDDAPLVLLRVGDRDLSSAVAAIRDGARPDAIVTGIGDRPELNRRARRLAADLDLAWLNDPVLFETALPGYRSKRHLQDLDYTPGRDADPYAAEEFEDTDMVRRVSRAVIGAQRDAGASAAWAGSFVSSAINDPWTEVNAALLRTGVDAASAFGFTDVIAPVTLRMSGFHGLEAQRLLVRSLAARRPTAYLLMLDGLHEASSADRIVSALRFGLLLQTNGVPVVLGRAGALRQLFSAFGLAGAEVGLGRLLRFALPDYKHRGGPGPTPPRFEAPSLVFGLRSDHARAALSLELIPEADCACPACRGISGVTEAIARVAEHDAHVICHEARTMRGVPPAERVQALDNRLRHSTHLWQAIRKSGIPVRESGRTDAWRRAIELSVQAGLLEPARVAEELRLFS